MVCSPKLKLACADTKPYCNNEFYKGLSGSHATVGLNAGDSINFVNVTGTNSPDLINISSTSNIGIPGMWAFQVNTAQISGAYISVIIIYWKTFLTCMS